MKVCSDCNKPKSDTDFYNKRDICKKCLFKMARNARGKVRNSDGDSSIGVRNPFARLAAAVIGQATKDAKGKGQRAYDAKLWFFGEQAELYAEGSETSISHMQGWAKGKLRKR